MLSINYRFWILTTLANLLSLSRFSGIWIFFFSDWDTQMKFLVYGILTLTDLVDGSIARLARPKFKGGTYFGRILEHTADKFLHVPGIIFLYSQVGLEGWLAAAVAVGEVYIAITVAREIYDQAKTKWEQGITKESWLSILEEAGQNKISESGKKKMVAYSLAAFFVFLDYLKPCLMFHGLYLVFFLAGLLFCWESRRDYI